jgi:hypothetical protein
MIVVGSCFGHLDSARADEANWEIGLQGGWSFANRDESFTQADLLAAYRLPWQWQLGDSLNLGTRATAAAGVLDGGGDTALLGSIGLELVFDLDESPLEIRFGGQGTLMSRYKFGDEDFGGAFQFTTYIGLDYPILKRLNAMALAQHMSNGGIYSKNPGVNFVMLGLRYTF